MTTVNVNGIRAAVKERSETNLGLLPWLAELTLQAVALQEIRATEEQAREALVPALDDGWHLAMSESTVKNHAGVGVLTRTEPTAVRAGFGSEEFDTLGRYLEVDVESAFSEITVASLYLPKGRSTRRTRRRPPRPMPASSTRRSASCRVRGVPAVRNQGAATPSSAVTGTSRPRERPQAFKTNKRSPGFQPHEREWVAGLLDCGWVDVTRELTGDVPGPYTWWSWRKNPSTTTPAGASTTTSSRRNLPRGRRSPYVHRAQAYDLRWSDHSAVTTVFS